MEVAPDTNPGYWTMKKTIVTFLLSLMVVSFAFAFTSCGLAKSEVKSGAKEVESVEEPRPDVVVEVEGISFVMKYVQGGKGVIGGPRDAQKVTINSFYMAETEVTQELWEKVMGKNPSRFQGKELEFHWGKEDNRQRPVERVSWESCQKFIEKLNEMTGKTFRLPTYPEWEYAARGGRNSKGYKFAGSDDITAVAWCDGNSSFRTQPVKQKAPNELGLYDMTGNVREWCQENENGYGVARGGGFHTGPEGSVNWWNTTCKIDWGDSDLGLRLVMSE